MYDVKRTYAHTYTIIIFIYGLMIGKKKSNFYD